MKALFKTPLDKLYSIGSIVALIMIIFPPVYYLEQGTATFWGYEFIFDLMGGFIDIGRLSIQLMALGVIILTSKRAIKKT